MYDYEKSSGSELIRRAKRGDPKAFSMLYSRNYTDMYRFALYMLGSSHDAEDAVSDTVISAYEGIARLRKDESFRSWIFTILSNRCLKILRGRSRDAAALTAEDVLQEGKRKERAKESEPDFAQKYARHQDVRDAFLKLEEEERLIVSFSVFGGYSSEEIGGMLKMNAATVRSRKSRALGKMRRMLEEEKPASLRVLVDNTAASENVGRFLGRTDYSVEVRQEGADLWCVSATACGCRVTEPEPAAATLTPGKTLVLITTETFGRGDDELGEKLMGNFLSTLPELGESLWRVILLNGGVKLAATPGKALDSLKALENAGTDVLVCGTCLDFYGLLEAKQAGQTTNMLDVVTSLALADKVIRP